MITSPGYWRPLNGFVGVIGIDSSPYQKLRLRLRNGIVSTVGFELEQVRNYIRQQEAADGADGQF